MWDLVLGFFHLILRVFLDFTLDVIYKRLRVIKIFMEKDLEFRSRYENYSFALMTTLILGLVKAESPTKKQGDKWDTARAYGLSSIKVIFILLTKVVAVNIRFSEI